MLFVDRYNPGELFGHYKNTNQLSAFPQEAHFPSYIPQVNSPVLASPREMYNHYKATKGDYGRDNNNDVYPTRPTPLTAYTMARHVFPLLPMPESPFVISHNWNPFYLPSTLPVSLWGQNTAFSIQELTNQASYLRQRPYEKDNLDSESAWRRSFSPKVVTSNLIPHSPLQDDRKSSEIDNNSRGVEVESLPSPVRTEVQVKKQRNTVINDGNDCIREIQGVKRKLDSGYEKQECPKPSKKNRHEFKCDQCSSSYKHRFELNRHIKVSHLRPHRCPECDKGFGHKNYLRIHIETVHKGIKSYLCKHCGKHLSTGGNLSVHIKTIHMGEKKYNCPICQRSFGQQCNMKTHMKRHQRGSLDSENFSQQNSVYNIEENESDEC